MQSIEEKPPFLYHGSTTGNIKNFKPRKRHTPGGPNVEVGPRIYATDNPAFAAMHAFPWSSDEGIDIDEREGKLILLIPTHLKERLNQEVFIYKINSDTFILTEEEKTGNTYHTESSVMPESVEKFSSVAEAIQHHGGAVVLIELN
jgi:hypothetical protein